jgi:hypothetical protein
MPNFTRGPSSRERIDSDEMQALLDTGSLLLDDRRRRPLYFDGRFLTARDLTRDQNYVLTRQADLSRTGNPGVVQGLMVTRDEASGATFVRLSAGHGITPSGELVLVSEETTIDLANVAQIQRLDVALGLSRLPRDPVRARTGLFVLALRLVEFTANAIATYPTRIDGDRSLQEGDIIEATAITLIPFPSSGTEAELDRRRSQVARQIFVETAAPGLPSNVLPLAMVALERGGIVRWVDPFLVRREIGTETDTVLTLGVAPAALREAHLLQYEQQLRDVLDLRGDQPFAATDYFEALPPAGPMPVGAITADFTQIFFPPEVSVELSVVPADELPLLLEESLLLPPIDLTASAEALESTAVVVLISAGRSQIDQLRSQLTSVNRPLLSNTTGLFARRKPLDVLQGLTLDRTNRLDRFTGGGIVLPSPNPESTEDATWRNQLAQVASDGGLLWYVRRRNLTSLVSESGFSTALSGGGAADAANEAATQLIRENPAAFEAVSANLETFNQLRLNPDLLDLLRRNSAVIAALEDDPERVTTLLANPDALRRVQTNPAVFDQIVQNPEIFDEIEENLPAFRLIVSSPDTFRQIQTSPDIFQRIAENPEVFESIRRNPQIFETIRRDPRPFDAIVVNPEIFEQIRTNPQIFDTIRANPQIFERIRLNPEIFDRVRDNPSLFDRVRDNVGAFDRVRISPEIFEQVRQNPAVFDTIRENPETFEQIRRDPTVIGLVRDNSAVFDRVRSHPTVFEAVSANPTTFDLVINNAAVFTAISADPASFDRVRNNAAAFTAISTSPEAFEVVRTNPDAFSAVSASPETFEVVRTNRAAFAAVSASPDVFEAVRTNPDAFSAVSANPSAFNLVRNNQVTFTAVSRSPETFELVRQNPTTFTTVSTNPDAFTAVSRNPEIFTLVRENVRTFEAIRGNEATFVAVRDNPTAFNRVVESPDTFERIRGNLGVFDNILNNPNILRRDLGGGPNPGGGPIPPR